MKRPAILVLGAWLVAGTALIGCNTPAPAPEKDTAQNAQPSAQPAAAQPAKGPEVVDACPHGHDACGDAAAAPAASDQKHFGKPFALTETKDLSAVAKEMGDEPTVVKVRGKVDKVCKKKGCWMTIRDGDVEARIVTYEGGFFFPTDAAQGREAVVEGRLEPKIVTKKFARHLAQDGGEDPEKVDGPQRELHLYASAAALD